MNTLSIFCQRHQVFIQDRLFGRKETNKYLLPTYIPTFIINPVSDWNNMQYPVPIYGISNFMKGDIINFAQKKSRFFHRVHFTVTGTYLVPSKDTGPCLKKNRSPDALQGIMPDFCA